MIACVGTCGDPKKPHIEGQEDFKGPIFHSSQLDGKDAKGKKVLVIGGGASAVEALEFAAHQNAAKVYILARSEKWIIPRNPFVSGKAKLESRLALRLLQGFANNCLWTLLGRHPAFSEYLRIGDLLIVDT